jgi:hypothetical protein
VAVRKTANGACFNIKMTGRVATAASVNKVFIGKFLVFGWFLTSYHLFDAVISYVIMEVNSEY